MAVSIRTHIFGIAVYSVCGCLRMGPKKSSIENPSWGQQMSGQQSFLVIQQGECFGTSGYWVEAHETGEEGFLEDFQDTFWVHDETQSFWMQRRFGGRFLRKGSSKGKGKGKRKGKGKGKGFSGRPFFNPFQPKGGKKGFTKSSSANPGKGPSAPGHMI
eukprot:4026367-Amphidinium_carterae.2